MKYLVQVVMFYFLIVPIFAQEVKNIEIINGALTTVTSKLADFHPNEIDPVLLIKTRDTRGLIFAHDFQPVTFKAYGSNYNGVDPVLQSDFSIQIPKNSALQAEKGLSLSNTGGSVNTSFEGLYTSTISPGDPSLSVGPNHLIQMINGVNGSASFQIFDKTGKGLTAKMYFDQMPGSSFNGAGDCITWYDNLEDRFVMTEFGDSSKTGINVNTLIIAVSQTNDPTGAWYVYEFYTDGFFPDYPKFSNWHNAWYGMSRDFTNSYLGNSVWAFDKKKMIAGDVSASAQRVRFVSPSNKYNSMCPISLAGNIAAPVGTPGMFLYYNDDNLTPESTDTDSLGIIGFSVDFNNPLNSKASIIKTLPVAAFNSTVCDTRNCASSANGQGYDVISSRIMNRPYYRNFGSYQSIVANHTVNASGSGTAGLRWYEIRKATGDWNIYQQSTFSPQQITACNNSAVMHRFIGAVTQNNKGQIALAYNNSSALQYASIGFTGRNEADPLNFMSYSEQIASKGTGYGTYGNRWGDYNDIVNDASNDSLYWVTAMYGSEFGWRTRIFSFKLGNPPQRDAQLISIDNPLYCENYCTNLIAPVIRFGNTGTSAITNLNINYSLNSGQMVSIPWKGNLLPFEETIVNLPSIVFPDGKTTFNVSLSNVNGILLDENPTNDALIASTNIGIGNMLPFAESFEDIDFPPRNWNLFTNSPTAANWEQSLIGAKSGKQSASFSNFNLNEKSTIAELRSPVISLNGLTGANLSFFTATAILDANKSDTLEVMVSQDCGKTFTSVFKKTSKDLTNKTSLAIQSYIPDSSDWKKTTLNLNNFTNSGKIIVLFRNLSGSGNTLFLDDINIKGYNLPKTDLALETINYPSEFICTPTLELNFKFNNSGKDTVKSAIFNYSFDNEASQSVNWTGALSNGNSTNFNLPVKSLVAGNHQIKLISKNPNGLSDENPLNDTLVYNFQVKLAQSLPIIENFEGNSFPPTQWNILNPDKSIAWAKNNTAGKSGNSSAFLNGFAYNSMQEQDVLVSPLIKTEKADSILLKFQTAYLSGGNNNQGMDTLEVVLSTDCGQNYTSIYKKWGKELETVGNIVPALTGNFIPRAPNQWRGETIDLTSSLPVNSNFIVAFKHTNNNGNNLYIDDIQLFAKNVSEKLIKNGYSITPNPFQNIIEVQHFPDAKTLKAIELFSSSGQRVYDYDYNIGLPPTKIRINLNNLPSGMYLIKLTYNNKVVTEKILKQ
jgi:hypothetical protein